MKPRFRFLAALFALVALSLSLAEGVWASTCAPGMGMDSAAMASMDVASHEVDCPAATIGSHTDRSGTDRNQTDVPHCPFVPAWVAGSCAVAASLPAGSFASLSPSAEGALLAVAPDDARDILLVSAFFRPPRA
jgi:hypothetical protein